MDFSKQIAEDQRLLLADIHRRIEAALQPFANDLDDFLAVLFQARLPADWRQQWHDFVVEAATKGFFVNPKSVVELEDWIEAWAAFCGLLPRGSELGWLDGRSGIRTPPGSPEHRAAPTMPNVDPRSDLGAPIMLASVRSGEQGTTPPKPVTPAPSKSAASVSSKPAAPAPPQPPASVGKFNEDGVEVAGPGPETTAWYRIKVRNALETLDPRIARWWHANSVTGLVRSRAAAFWQSSHYSRMVEGNRPIIVVNEDYTAGQTAQAIIAEVTGGWFADSIGAFYKKYRVAQTGDDAEFRKWQLGAVNEAAQLASQLAEMYVSGIATLTPAGDLVLFTTDVMQRGLKLDQLVNLLPLLGHLPIGAIVVKLGKRELKLSKQLARDFEKLSVEQRSTLLAKAAAAKTDEEAVATIKRGIASHTGTPTASAAKQSEETITVYRSVTGDNVNYVGITNSLARRAAEHLRARGILIEKLLANLSRSDARALEQALIEHHGLGKTGGTLLNRINGIAATNPAYADQLRRGLELLKSIGY